MHNTKFSFWVAIFILFISLNACKRNITTEKDMEELTCLIGKKRISYEYIFEPGNRYVVSTLLVNNSTDTVYIPVDTIPNKTLFLYSSIKGIYNTDTILFFSPNRINYVSPNETRRLILISKDVISLDRLQNKKDSDSVLNILQSMKLVFSNNINTSKSKKRFVTRMKFQEKKRDSKFERFYYKLVPIGQPVDY